LAAFAVVMAGVFELQRKMKHLPKFDPTLAWIG